MRSAVLVVNPFAGARKAPRRAAELAGELRQLGVATRLVATDAAARGAKLHDHLRGADVAIAVGGDGTLNAVVHAILTLPRIDAGALPAVAMLAAGTGNVAVAAFGLPTTPRDVASLVVAGTTRAVDAGLILREGTLVAVFVLWSGVGIDAALIEAVAQRRQRYRGWRLLAEYVREAASMAVRYHFPRIELSTDSSVGRFGAVAVANVGRLIFGSISRHADPSDGSLDLIATGARTRVGWGLALLAYAFRRYELCPRVTRLSVKQVTLRSEQRVPIHADGEPAGALPVDILIQASAIQLLAPPSPPPRQR